MRRFFQIQYPQRRNTIFLNYGKNMHRFTFLQSDFHNCTSDKSKIPQIDESNIMQKINKYKQIYGQIQKYDFTQQDLIKIYRKQKNKPQSNTVWSNNSQIISQMSDCYNKMQQKIYENLNKNNIKDSILKLSQFNAIDIKIWQKVIAYIEYNYKNDNLDNRLVYISAINEYLKKFEYSYKSKQPFFKFMFPQSYIVDLIDFRNMFKQIQNEDDFIKDNDCQKQQTKKLQLLQNKISLIMKATKKADMNIYQVRQYFEKRTQQMIKICSKYKKSILHRNLLHSIYHFYSYMNYNNPVFYEQVQKYYYEHLRQIIFQNTFKQNQPSSVSKKSNQSAHYINKSKEVNKLLSIWKFNQRTNLQIYYQLIKPYLNFLIDKKYQINYYANIAINLLSAGIKDYQVISKMIEQLKANQGIDDQFTHMVKHHLNIANKKLTYESNFHKCKSMQNPKLTRYLKQQNLLYSSCLQYNQSNNKTNSKNIQHYKVQKIWSDIIKQLFNSKYEVIQNAILCNYQIDFLVMTKDKLIGIQIEGSHYTKKSFNTNKNQNDQLQTTGKKTLKYSLTQAYKINIIRIHCQQKLPTYIMQSRDIQLGKRYLTQKLQQYIGIEINLI